MRFPMCPLSWRVAVLLLVGLNQLLEKQGMLNQEMEIKERQERKSPKREEEMPKREEEIPKREEEMPKREEEMPKREMPKGEMQKTKSPKREAEMPKREEEMPKREEEIPKREEEIPKRERQKTKSPKREIMDKERRVRETIRNLKRARETIRNQMIKNQRSQRRKIEMIMEWMNQLTTNFGVLIFHWSKFWKNVWKIRLRIKNTLFVFGIRLLTMNFYFEIASLTL